MKIIHKVFDIHMAIIIVMCISCNSAESEEHQITQTNQIVIQKKCDESLSIVSAGTYIRDNRISVYDRKRGVLAISELNDLDTIVFNKCMSVDKNGIFADEILLNNKDVLVEADFRSITISSLGTFSPFIPDTSLYSRLILDSYTGRKVEFLADSILIFGVVFTPLGQLLSDQWIINHMAYEKFLIFNLNQKTFRFIQNSERERTFNAFFEHPVFTSSSRYFFHTYPHTNTIQIYHYSEWNCNKIVVKSNNVDVAKFDERKLSSNEYRHLYYQSNSFTVSLLFDEKNKNLVRCIKLPQDATNKKGLNNPPSWANHLFEIINIKTGEVEKSFTLKGEIYNVTFSFFHDGVFYVNNIENSNEEYLAFDGFSY